MPDRFEDHIDRAHCRLDYHKALERGVGKRGALADWALRWGERIANELRHSEADDVLAGELADAKGERDDAKDAETASQEELTQVQSDFEDLEKAVKSAIASLHRRDVDGALDTLEAA